MCQLRPSSRICVNLKLSRSNAGGGTPSWVQGAERPALLCPGFLPRQPKTIMLRMNRLLAHRQAPEAILLFATALWGLAFLIVHLGVATVPPLPFVALRFATAALMVRLLTGTKISRVTATELRAGPL